MSCGRVRNASLAQCSRHPHRRDAAPTSRFSIIARSKSRTSPRRRPLAHCFSWSGPATVPRIVAANPRSVSAPQCADDHQARGCRCATRLQNRALWDRQRSAADPRSRPIFHERFRRAESGPGPRFLVRSSARARGRRRAVRARHRRLRWGWIRAGEMRSKSPSAPASTISLMYSKKGVDLTIV